MNDEIREEIKKLLEIIQSIVDLSTNTYSLTQEDVEKERENEKNFLFPTQFSVHLTQLMFVVRIN